MIPVLKSVRKNMASWYDSSFVYPRSGRIADDAGMFGFAHGIGYRYYVADDIIGNHSLWITLETDKVTPCFGKCIFRVANVVAVHSTIKAAALDMQQRTRDWTTPGAVKLLSEYNASLVDDPLWLIDIAHDITAQTYAEAEAEAEAERLRRRAVRQAERAYWRTYVLVPRPAPDAILVDWPVPEYARPK